MTQPPSATTPAPECQRLPPALLFFLCFCLSGPSVAGLMLLVGTRSADWASLAAQSVAWESCLLSVILGMVLTMFVGGRAARICGRVLGIAGLGMMGLLWVAPLVLP